MVKWLRPNPDSWALAALGVAWLGIWGAWISHPAVALTQNVFYWAEWSTFLLDVRNSGLKPFPEILRLAVTLSTLALCVGLGRIHDRWHRWGTRLLAVPVGLILAPPYPDLFQLWWSPSYGGRFAVMSVLWIGLAGCFLSDRAAIRTRQWITVSLAIGAVACAIGSAVALLPPFLAHYASELAPGWGIEAFLGGLLIASGLELNLIASSRAEQ